jgi:hypothetical protein
MSEGLEHISKCHFDAISNSNVFLYDLGLDLLGIKIFKHIQFTGCGTERSKGALRPLKTKSPPSVSRLCRASSFR